MKPELRGKIARRLAIVSRWLHGPHMLAFLPALALGGFWLGGELALITVALGLPVFYATFATRGVLGAGPAQPFPDLMDAAAAQQLAEKTMLRAKAAHLATACIMIEAADLDSIARRAGDDTAQSLRDTMLLRLRALMRRDDRAVRVGDSRFMVLLGPSLRLDLEALLTMTDRIQRGLEEPIESTTGTHYLAVAIGFCSSARLKDENGAQMLDAAQIALTEALANGPSAIRAWSDSMRAERRARKTLLSEVERALAKGQIQPWFQPQLCTSTGQISGVEALARWLHPERGIVPPMEFLTALEEAGQMDRLSEVVLQHSLTALCGWDEQNIEIPRVGVNFSDVELRSPQLIERIKWELDRFGLPASRLGIEVLETVIAESPEGIVARNIVNLSKLGCQIDLDDFGTGHASITALRRFTVHRLKIDRSFVTRVDRDEEQRRMLAAVLGLADRLGLETVAEGVESVSEHALLSQLGCDHVQGFGIARPMPADQLAEWARNHAERIARVQSIGRGTG